MDWLQAVVLALLQGVTEFLPISSSAHLILLPRLFGWPDQGLAFDVAVHVGSLAAVMAYFRRDIATLFLAWWRSLGGAASADARLAWMVVVATVPVLVAGLLLSDAADTLFRNPLVIAATTIGFGIVLLLADRWSQRTREESSLGWRDALFIGAAQALALVPGTSRSGITITAGLMLGMTRHAASRFSFLLSIPVILAAGGMKTLELVNSPIPVPWAQIGVATALSAVSAYLCIHYFLKLIERIGVVPFVVYRVALGLFLVYLFAK